MSGLPRDFTSAGNELDWNVAGADPWAVLDLGDAGMWTMAAQFYAHGLLTLATDEGLGMAGCRYLFRLEPRGWDWLCAYVDRIAARVHAAGWVTPERTVTAVPVGERHEVLVTTLTITDTGRSRLVDLEPEGGWL